MPSEHSLRTTPSTEDCQPLGRSFRDLSEEDVANIEEASRFTRSGSASDCGWEELLRSRRILLVSEAGTGKTYECQTQKVRLWEAGEAAFFLDLATLAGNSVREMLRPEEEERLDAWVRSQSDIATFFLDSIDELKLTLGKFDQALNRFSKALSGQLGRARIIITTRPVPIDRTLIRSYLPVPLFREAEPTAEAFADMVMNRQQDRPADEEPRTWRNVSLMPLSRKQMHTFARLQGVSDPDVLLADIIQRGAEEFAERPQDLIELCSDWREHHRIRFHREQVETNVATKLKPSAERPERAELSQEAAIEGAARLALAATLTRKLTLRYSADTDNVHASEAALDVSKILQNWSGPAQTTLLERPLFGFASYGRVRFHHRSVVEYLAARRLAALLARGISVKLVKRLLFTDTAQGVHTVRPSMRPVAAWLALSHDTIFDDILRSDPAVVLDHGDPQSLSPTQRVRALEAYVARYGRGGWRGLEVPRIQVHRFAARELGDTVTRLWTEGVENPEVRELLLQLVAAGSLDACTDIAHTVAYDATRTARERSLAIEALLRLNDPRVDDLSASMETDIARWPEAATRRAVLLLFPAHMPATRLSQILRRVRERHGGVGELNYTLPRKIAAGDLTPEYVEQLRQVLTRLIAESLEWTPSKVLHLQTTRPDLIAALLATCHCQATEGIRTEAWIDSSLIAIRLAKEDTTYGNARPELLKAIAKLRADARKKAFWREDACIRRIHEARDMWDRVYTLWHEGGLQLDAGRDAAWVRKCLSDPNEPADHREMMLWTEMLLLNHGAEPQELLHSLKPLVSDVPNLTAIIDDRLRPQEGTEELRRLMAANAKHTKKRQRDDAKAHASWITFWREIVQDPDAVFAVDRAQSTAWNLWRAVERSGQKSRASGWDRHLIEEQFGKPVADRLRRTMMEVWRHDRPTLRSERPDSEKDTFLVRWQFGLAGIAAEAEDPDWALGLTEDEAKLACRYAPIQLNGLPSWLECLAAVHPAAVDSVLGWELSHSLGEATSTGANSMLLQDISYAPARIAALFISRIRTWVSDIAQADSLPDRPQLGHNLRQAIVLLIKNGQGDDRDFVKTIATSRLAAGLNAPLADVWLPVVLHLAPDAGVEALENALKESSASPTGTGVHLFARLSNRDDGDLGVNLRAPEFTPQLLLRLLRLAYQHVRVADDVRHEGIYRPGVRDNAERSRNMILEALLSTTGREGWEAKREMAADPLFEDIKSRVIARAEEKAAEEADNVVLTEADFTILDNTGEAPPTTRDAMFALIRDRLDDIDDLLLQDISPRDLWAGITDEHVMRRELARELRSAGGQIYTIDQEAVTADEKETDIRFRSKGSNVQGVIELKLGDDRSGSDLFNTIHDQLLTKYMAPEECRAGCLLVTIAKTRRWDHPKTGRKIEFEELMAVLNEEAERRSKELGGATKIMARGLDLRPRLGKEAKSSR